MNSSTVGICPKANRRTKSARSEVNSRLKVWVKGEQVLCQIPTVHLGHDDVGQLSLLHSVSLAIAIAMREIGDRASHTEVTALRWLSWHGRVT